MTYNRHSFGWSLPPGVTYDQLDPPSRRCVDCDQPLTDADPRDELVCRRCQLSGDGLCPDCEADLCDGRVCSNPDCEEPTQ